MGLEERKAVLNKLAKKTFEEQKSKHVFKPAIVIGSTLDDEIGILLTANEDLSKMILQVGKTSLKMNVDSLDFLIKGLVTIGAMLAAEGKNAFRDKLRADNEIHSKPNENISFMKLLSANKTQEGMDESADLITAQTDFLIKSNVDLEGIRKETEENLDSMKIEVNSSLKMTIEVFKQAEKDLLDLRSRGVDISDAQMNVIDSQIASFENLTNKLDSIKSVSTLMGISSQLFRAVDKVSYIHKKYCGKLPLEEQAEIVDRLFSIIEKIPNESKQEEVILSKKEIDLNDQESVDKMLDAILEEGRAVEKAVSPIEEGVMEELVSEEVFNKESQEIEEYLEQHPENTPNNDFDAMFPEVKEDLENIQITGEETDLFGDLAENVIYDENDEVANPFEVTEEEQGNPYEDMEELEFPEEEVFEDGETYQKYQDRPELEEGEEVGYDFEDGIDDIPLPGNAIEDEEEEEEIEDGFFKRMTDLESTLTGEFQKLEDEIPTFEKIEKLRVEYGELAAKEYVSSLTQEQKEHLVKERMALKIAAAEKLKQTSNQ